ncbi:MAG: hypothetical protein MI784_16450 [Cytophagales bacterium]|nr:hypothetical protein [Cytophagales bacterium]
MKKTGLIALGLTIFFGCNQKKVERLEHKVDSLQTVLTTTAGHNEKMTTQLNGIDNLLDQIESMEQSVKLSIEEKAPSNSTLDRVKNIQSLFAKLQSKVGDLEASIQKSEKTSRNLRWLVRKLKKEAKAKDAEIAALKQQVEQLLAENKSLNNRVAEQASAISSLNDKLDQANKDMEDLKNATKKTRAEILYDEAAVLEQFARKTFFNGKRKRERYAKAYQLYKEAFELGKAEAEAKMKELEPKVKK